MELKDFTRGIAPKPKPVIQKPTGLNVQRSPYAPVTRAPVVTTAPAIAPTQSKFGSPSAVGFNPAYTPPVKKESAPFFPSQFPFQGSMGATTPLLGNSVKPNSIPPFLLRTLPDFAVDAIGLGIAAPPLGAAAAAWGEGAAQQYEMYAGNRKEKSPEEVALAGTLGLLPFATGQLIKGATKVGAKIANNFTDPLTAKFIGAVNEKTKKDIIENAVRVFREGKLPDAAAAGSLRDSHRKAIAGVEMATGNATKFPDKYPIITDQQMAFLESAIRGGANDAQIANIMRQITTYPEGFIGYDKGIVNAVKAIYGPPQEQYLKNIVERVAQDQSYPLAFNANNPAARQILQTGEFRNAFGLQNPHYFTEAVNFRPEEFEKFLQKRLNHEMLVRPDLYPPNYSVTQAQENFRNHPFYTYHSKPEPDVLQDTMMFENARPFGKYTFHINDRLKQNATTSPGDSVWQQNFLPYGDLDINNIATAIRPDVVDAYTYQRLGTNPLFWPARSFDTSWSEAQIYGGLKLDDIDSVTIRQPDIDPNRVRVIKEMLDRRNIPYTEQNYPREMGFYWD